MIFVICRFGQAEGFIKLRERFETIMGFKKSELTSSVISEEKVSNEITEKENEEIKSNSTENMPSITENIEVVTINLYLTLCNFYNHMFNIKFYFYRRA